MYAFSSFIDDFLFFHVLLYVFVGLMRFDWIIGFSYITCRDRRDRGFSEIVLFLIFS